VKPIAAGLLGGLVATVVLDVIVVGLFPFIGMPADSSFSVIGDTAARFFSMLDIEMAGGIPLGLLVHYLTGLSLGGLFGAARHGVALGSIRKERRWTGILYTEVISIPSWRQRPSCCKCRRRVPRNGSAWSLSCTVSMAVCWRSS